MKSSRSLGVTSSSPVGILRPLDWKRSAPMSLLTWSGGILESAADDDVGRTLDEEALVLLAVERDVVHAERELALDEDLVVAGAAQRLPLVVAAAARVRAFVLQTERGPAVDVGLLRVLDVGGSDDAVRRHAAHLLL